MFRRLGDVQAERVAARHAVQAEHELDAVRGGGRLQRVAALVQPVPAAGVVEFPAGGEQQQQVEARVGAAAAVQLAQQPGELQQHGHARAVRVGAERQLLPHHTGYRATGAGESVTVSCSPGRVHTDGPTAYEDRKRTAKETGWLNECPESRDDDH